VSFTHSHGVTMTEILANNERGNRWSDIIVVCAFYGTEGTVEAMRQVHKILKEWFRSLDRKPDRAGMTVSDTESHVGRPSTIDEKLASAGFEHTRGYEISQMLPGWRNPNQFLVRADAERDAGYVYIAVDQTVLGLDALYQTQTCNDLIKMMRPSYGIAYARHRDMGPSLYAVGIPHGLALSGPQYEEAVHISRWSDIGMSSEVYRRGLLRDIYPVNWLNASQIAADVNGERLEQWIRGDADRGQLTPTAAWLARWTIDPEHIDNARRTLWAAGVIFDWRRQRRVVGE
jgi:hypothetical protein